MLSPCLFRSCWEYGFTFFPFHFKRVNQTLGGSAIGPSASFSFSSTPPSSASWGAPRRWKRTPRKQMGSCHPETLESFRNAFWRQEEGRGFVDPHSALKPPEGQWMEQKNWLTLSKLILCPFKCSKAPQEILGCSLTMKADTKWPDSSISIFSGAEDNKENTNGKNVLFYLGDGGWEMFNIFKVVNLI